MLYSGSKYLLSLSDQELLHPNIFNQIIFEFLRNYIKKTDLGLQEIISRGHVSLAGEFRDKITRQVDFESVKAEFIRRNKFLDSAVAPLDDAGELRKSLEELTMNSMSNFDEKLLDLFHPSLMPVYLNLNMCINRCVTLFDSSWTNFLNYLLDKHHLTLESIIRDEKLLSDLNRVMTEMNYFCSEGLEPYVEKQVSFYESLIERIKNRGHIRGGLIMTPRGVKVTCGEINKQILFVKQYSQSGIKRNDLKEGITKAEKLYNIFSILTSDVSRLVAQSGRLCTAYNLVLNNGELKEFLSSVDDGKTWINLIYSKELSPSDVEVCEKLSKYNSSVFNYMMNVYDSPQSKKYFKNGSLTKRAEMFLTKSLYLFLGKERLNIWSNFCLNSDDLSIGADKTFHKMLRKIKSLPVEVRDFILTEVTKNNSKNLPIIIDYFKRRALKARILPYLDSDDRKFKHFNELVKLSVQYKEFYDLIFPSLDYVEVKGSFYPLKVSSLSSIESVLEEDTSVFKSNVKMIVSDYIPEKDVLFSTLSALEKSGLREILFSRDKLKKMLEIIRYNKSAVCQNAFNEKEYSLAIYKKEILSAVSRFKSLGPFSSFIRDSSLTLTQLDLISNVVYGKNFSYYADSSSFQYIVGLILLDKNEIVKKFLGLMEDKFSRAALDDYIKDAYALLEEPSGLSEAEVFEGLGHLEEKKDELKQLSLPQASLIENTVAQETKKDSTFLKYSSVCFTRKYLRDMKRYAQKGIDLSITHDKIQSASFFNVAFHRKLSFSFRYNLWHSQIIGTDEDGHRIIYKVNEKGELVYLAVCDHKQMQDLGYLNSISEVDLTYLE